MLTLKRKHESHTKVFKQKFLPDYLFSCALKQQYLLNVIF